MTSINTKTNDNTTDMDTRNRVTTTTFTPGPKPEGRDVYNKPKRLTRTGGVQNDFIEWVLIQKDTYQSQISFPDHHIYELKGTVLAYICHGLGRHLDASSIKRWGECGTRYNIDIVVHNYPGFGETPGLATEEQINEDALNLLKHVLETNKQYKEVVLLGNSIGCGPTVYLAAASALHGLPINKVVLISPWTSLFEVMPTFFTSKPCPTVHKEDIENALRVNEKLQYDVSGTDPVLKFLKDNERNDEFDSFQSIKSVEKLVGKKVLIIHGEHDTAIPSNVHYEAFIKEFKEKLGAQWMETNLELCLMPGCEHVATRLWSDDVIWEFVHGNSELKDIIRKAKDRGGPPEYMGIHKKAVAILDDKQGTTVVGSGEPFGDGRD